MRDSLRQFIDALASKIDVQDIVDLEACFGCGRCGAGCAWYLETGDEALHPRAKSDLARKIYQRHLTLEGRVLGAFGLRSAPDLADIRASLDALWKCTACGRCTLYCPQGLRPRRLIRLARRACCDAGLLGAKPTLQAIVDDTQAVSHSFGLTPLQVQGRMALFLDHQQIELPIDIPGSQYLLICPGVGSAKIPDRVLKVIKIFNAAGVDYTSSSRLTDTGSEIEHVSCHDELSRRMLLAWEEEALRLGVGQILVPECGCDTRTIFVDAEEVLGRPLRVEARTIDAVFVELIESGALPVDPVENRVTMHDPCYVNRLSGLGETSRRLLALVARDVVDMYPNGHQNHCCNGGAGGFRLPENVEARRRASAIKADQIRATGAEHVVSPCVVCMLSIQDTCIHYGMTMPGQQMSLAMFEVVYEAMMRALRARGEQDRVRVPLPLRGRDDAFFSKHGLRGMMLPRLLENEDLGTFVDWIANDDVMSRYILAHPDAEETLAKWGCFAPKPAKSSEVVL